MKKVLLISLIVALAFWGIYPSNTKKEIPLYYVDAKPMQTESQTIKKETVQPVGLYQEIKKNHHREKSLFIETELDVNTTRDTDCILTAHIKNSDPLEASNYFWRKNGQLLGIGSSIERSFSKGLHFIELIIKNGEEERNVTIRLKAWDYKKIQNVNIEHGSDTKEIINEEVYDYKQRLIKRYSKYSTYSVLYNEENQKVEDRNEYRYLSETGEIHIGGRIKRYSYNTKGKILTMQKLSLEEESHYFEKNSYDEKGELVLQLSGEDSEHLIEQSQFYNNTVYDDSESHITYIEYDYPNPIVKYNKNKKIIYREYDYGYMTEKTSYEYDENNKHRKTIRISDYDGQKSTTTNTYDKEGNVLSREQIRTEGEEVICHYNITSTYNNSFKIATQKQKIIDGECSKDYIKNSFKRYVYNNDGSLKETLSFENNHSKEPLKTAKILKFYSNTLERE